MRQHIPGRRRASVVTAGVALALLLAGCGGLPTSGGIRVERSLPAAPDGQVGAIQVLPPGPTAGASPVEIVSGFLAAQADSDADYAVARSYLSPQGIWDPTGTVTTYTTYDAKASASRLNGPGVGSSPPPDSASANPSVASTPSGAVGVDGTRATVTVRLSRTALIDRNGNYQPKVGVQVLQVPLEVTGGQWRISAMPSGLLLTLRDLQRSYLPEMLWWWNADGTLLVPEQRWFPAATGALPTLLVKALLAGPQADLSGGVRTAFPTGTTLRGSATVVGSDVLVDLDRTAAGLGASAATALLRQLAQTLGQVPGATGVRLTVEGQSLPLPGLPARVPTSIVGTADPDAEVTGPAFALRGGVPVALDPDHPSIPAAVHRLGAGLEALAITGDQGRAAALAGVSGGRSQLVVATANSGPMAIGEPGDHVGLGYDEVGDLLVAGPSGLSLLSAAGTLTAVRGALPSEPIAAVAFARDGARVALVAGPAGRRALYLGVLHRDGDTVTLTGVHALTPSLTDVRAVSWAGSEQLDVLATDSTQAPVAVWTCAVDGSQLQSIALGSAVTGVPTGIAAADASTTLIADAGTVYTRGVVGWRQLAAGTAPTYAY